MPRKPNSLPAYCLHRASGQAIVRINGRDHYLGTYDTASSRAEYDRVVAEWLVSGRQSATPATRENHSLFVNEVLLAYVEFPRSITPMASTFRQNWPTSNTHSKS